MSGAVSQLAGGAAPAVALLVAGRIATVTLNRPDRRNAVSLEMWRELARLFEALGRDEALRGILLTGAGGNFSVGADIAEFASVRATAEQSLEYEVAVDAASTAIAATPKPVVAAIEGYCLGGGCHLALACDFRFVAPDAALGIPAARLSIVYGVASTRRLLALVGLSAAKRILFSAERFGAEAAVAMGLAERRARAPAAAAQDFLEGLAENAPLSIAGAKFILNGLAVGEEPLDPAAAQAVIDRASRSDDYREGREAFAGKRPPAFTGR
ncbi:MAG: enoyl-CoA hydratase-related protein [Tistlia sp.]|uniref:enoyl-CoA hydratase-related protein n=1 Tax=Tistlia sp. TaxID=3057121 RepID=UPI0034A23A4A